MDNAIKTEVVVLVLALIGIAVIFLINFSSARFSPAVEEVVVRELETKFDSCSAIVSGVVINEGEARKTEIECYLEAFPMVNAEINPRSEIFVLDHGESKEFSMSFDTNCRENLRFNCLVRD